MKSAFTHRCFWLVFAVTAAVLGAFFAWELGYFNGYLPSLPRVPPTQGEIIFTVLLIFMMAFNAGLFAWWRKHGHCPVSTGIATGTAGVIGAVALLCPVCLFFPASLLGLGLGLAFLTPFVPLLRIIAVILLIASAMMLWPRK